MRQKVKFNALCKILTAAVLVIFAVGFYALRDTPDELIFFGIIAGGSTIASVYYCPTDVEANESGITLHRLLGRPKFFAYEDIQSVDTCYPSGGGIRLCGSGGFFGFWGYFNDIMIGTYFGYYGSRSHCFLIKLKSGRQYVVGCEDPYELVDYINSEM